MKKQIKQIKIKQIKTKKHIQKNCKIETTNKNNSYKLLTLHNVLTSCANMHYCGYFYGRYGYQKRQGRKKL